MLLVISKIGVAEAMSLGMNLGMDPHTLAEVINHSSGRCWSSDTNNPVPNICPNAPASHEYQGGFASGLMQDRKSTRLNSSHVAISYAVFCLKNKRAGQRWLV